MQGTRPTMTNRTCPVAFGLPPPAPLASQVTPHACPPPRTTPSISITAILALLAAYLLTLVAVNVTKWLLRRFQLTVEINNAKDYRLYAAMESWISSTSLRSVYLLESSPPNHTANWPSDRAPNEPRSGRAELWIRHARGDLLEPET